MLCYAMLCYAMLCCAVLCCAVLCCAMLCYAMLYYTILYYTIAFFESSKPKASRGKSLETSSEAQRKLCRTAGCRRPVALHRTMPHCTKEPHKNPRIQGPSPPFLRAFFEARHRLSKPELGRRSAFHRVAWSDPSPVAESIAPLGS